MQEIERKVNKTAKDKSDLAQLKVRQEQILASGKPVEANPVTQVCLLTFVSLRCLFLFASVLCSPA